MNLPEHYLYLESHEWINPETGVVGITDHAQNELSDVVYVELPVIGRLVEAGEAVAVVESVKAASDIYAPMSGEVVEVNSALADNPALVNQSPFEEGWLFKVKLSSPEQSAKLIDAARYQKLLQA
ncbi:MAG: glycine cleavage system protein GcvH [Candidatus Methylacidiphilales bacterium]